MCPALCQLLGNNKECDVTSALLQLLSWWGRKTHNKELYLLDDAGFIEIKVKSNDKTREGTFNFNWAQSGILMNVCARWSNHKRPSTTSQCTMYLTAFMLMHSTFSSVISCFYPRPARSHTLSSTQGYCSRSSHSNTSIIFSSLLEHSCCLQMHSYFSHLKN